MKLDFETIISRKVVEYGDLLAELEAERAAYQASGVSGMHMVLNPYEGEQRPVYIVGIHDNGGKIQFRSCKPRDKEGGLVMVSREMAYAVRAMLAYEYPIRSFVVTTVDGWMIRRIESVQEIYNALQLS